MADTTIAEPIVGPSAPPIEPEKLEERRRLEGEARKHIRSFKHDADAKQHNIGTYRMALQFASHGLRVIPVHSINPDGSAAPATGRRRKGRNNRVSRSCDAPAPESIRAASSGKRTPQIIWNGSKLIGMVSDPRKMWASYSEARRAIWLSMLTER